MAERYVNPVPQYEDGSGNILAGGKLFFYASGTLIFKAIFSDINGLIPLANPVVLDASGTVPEIFYLGSYKVILTDKDGVQQFERDPVTASINSFKKFLAWDSATIFFINDIARADDGNLYESITNSNQNNEPSITPASWSKIDFLGTWNINESYSVNVVVKGSDGNLYRAINAQTGNDPVSDLVNWAIAVKINDLGTTTGELFSASKIIADLAAAASTLSASGGAALIGNTPAGNIAATDVQAAIDELDTEKQPLDADLTTISTNGIGTAANQFIQLNASAQIPALDGSLLTGLKGSDVANTPAGNIVATTVQAAVNELDTDLTTLIKNNSGLTEPTTTFAYMWWADTTSGLLKQRNAANTGWINVLTLAGINGADIRNTPAGNIAAADVQAAINELDTEKADDAATTSSLNLKAAISGQAFTGNVTAPNLPPTYQTQTVTLGGDFGSQTIVVTKIGNVVTLASNSNLTHLSSNIASSSGNILPSWAIPSGHITNIYYFSTSDTISTSIICKFEYSTIFNNIQLRYGDGNLASKTSTTSQIPPFLTYVV